MYIDSDNDIKYVIERKTLDDLSSSIIDGRYKEQKSRLLASGYKIIYIFEGISKNNFGVKFSTLISAMLNTQFRDNITVIRTKDLKETADVLIALKEKLRSLDNVKQITYESSIKVSKKQNMTKNTIFINQLSCIPGISDKISRDIADFYPSMKNLIEILEENGPLHLTHINGIGKVISKKIYEILIEI